ncbi:MAG: hypothetical protein HZC41_24400 [Chloroflexi bacterium]|nr:hypothetical protein [Chloroflexota bacterium]
MANEQHRRLMQDALDEQLTPEAQHELHQQLSAEPDAAAEFDRLRRVEQLLRSAPMERAPQRLALSIMARLAETLQSKEQLAHTSGLALALALALVVVVALPLLVASAWLFLSAVSSAAALSSLIQSIVTLLTLLMGMMEAFIQQAQTVVADYPQAPALLIVLVPVALVGLMRYLTTQPPDDSDAEV